MLVPCIDTQTGNLTAAAKDHEDLGLTTTGRYKEVHIANGSERWLGRAFMFQFGAYSCTRVLAFGSGIEDALEEAAGWLADNEPGHFTEPEYASDDPNPEEVDEAEADLTYTESGWLCSWEWTVDDVDMLAATEAALIDEFQATPCEFYRGEAIVVAYWHWIKNHAALAPRHGKRRLDAVIPKFPGHWNSTNRSLWMIDDDAGAVYARLLIKSLETATPSP